MSMHEILIILAQGFQIWPRDSILIAVIELSGDCFLIQHFEMFHKSTAPPTPTKPGGSFLDTFCRSL